MFKVEMFKVVMFGKLFAGSTAGYLSELSRVLLQLHGHLDAEREPVSSMPRPHHNRQPLQRTHWCATLDFTLFYSKILYK